MAAACASETLATQPTQDAKSPNRNNINNESLLKLKTGRRSNTANF
jgi:hypothetical protein